MHESLAIRRVTAVVAAATLLALAPGCAHVLRAQGSEPRDPRPALEELAPLAAEYRVFVIVPWLRVNTYPAAGATQQPMLQFTGDVENLDRGLGRVAMLVAPDRFVDGDEVTFFEDKVLWEDRLREDDRRTFTLWLRENNRSAPTRIDEKLAPIERVAELVEELSGASGFRVPVRRALTLSVQLAKELQRDWLVLRWSCPWQHVIRAARARLDAAAAAAVATSAPAAADANAAASRRQAVILRARVVSSEVVKGKPAAEATVLFVVKRVERPLPAGVN